MFLDFSTIHARLAMEDGDQDWRAGSRRGKLAFGCQLIVVLRILFVLSSLWIAVPAAAAEAVAPGSADPVGVGREGALNAAIDPVRIWYRSSEGCPEGSAFVARLGELGRQAALAEIGDSIDFVVTLAMHGDKSAGRLERQTQGGTVAIRELSAATCNEVAEALALTLELTLAPAGQTEAASEARPRLTNTGILPVRAPSGTAARDAVSDRALPATEAGRTDVRLELGARVGVASGLAPGLGLGGSAFVGLGPFARFSVLGTYAQGDAEPGDGPDSEEISATLTAGLVAGRLDSCPFGYRGDRLELHPCLGLELGLLWARSAGEEAQTDEGLWSGGLGLLRAGLRLTPSMWAEIELGARVPFVRYAMTTTTGAELSRTPALGGVLDLGIRWEP